MATVSSELELGRVANDKPMNVTYLIAHVI